jgi:hypothetical protein
MYILKHTANRFVEPNALFIFFESTYFFLPLSNTLHAMNRHTCPLALSELTIHKVFVFTQSEHRDGPSDIARLPRELCTPRDDPGTAGAAHDHTA